MKDYPDFTVPIVLGPTAVGKTELIHEAARRLGREVISADSRAVYREMNIGTATPPESLRKEVPYHLVNCLDPRERYSAAEFREDVEEKLEVIHDRGRKPIVVGGSRLYIVALTQGIFDGPGADEELRSALRDQPDADLMARLEQVDPVSAEKIHRNDTKRLVRALEVYELTGKPISVLKEETEPLPVEFKKLGLDRPRKQLYGRIDTRVEEMLEKGLLDEVESLIQRGFGPDWGAWETIGYKELALHLKGKYEFEEAVDEIKKNTRHLAKYQQNWMGGEEDLIKIDLAEREVTPGRIVDLIS